MRRAVVAVLALLGACRIDDVTFTPVDGLVDGTPHDGTTDGDPDASGLDGTIDGMDGAPVGTLRHGYVFEPSAAAASTLQTLDKTTSGALSARSPASAGGATGTELAIFPSGTHLYMAGMAGGGPGILDFTIANGNVTNPVPQSTGGNCVPIGLAIRPQNDFLAYGCVGSPQLGIMPISPTGALQSPGHLASNSTLGRGYRVVWDREGMCVYGAAGTAGQPTLVAGFAFSVPAQTLSFVVDTTGVTAVHGITASPTDDYVFVSGETVQAYFGLAGCAIDVNGASLPGDPASSQHGFAVVNPLGTRLYTGDRQINTFDIDPTSGQITMANQTNVVGSAVGAAFDPDDGTTLYVANVVTANPPMGRVTPYDVSVPGSLTEGTSVPLAGIPAAFVLGK